MMTVMTHNDYYDKILGLGVPQDSLQVQSGWYPLVFALLTAIKEKEPSFDFSRIEAIKQKFGEMRVLWNFVESPEIFFLVKWAAHESLFTCEICSREGNLVMPNDFSEMIACQSCYQKHILKKRS